MSRLRLNKRPIWAGKLTLRTSQFRHFRGEVFVFGRIKHRGLLRYLCGLIDEQVLRFESVFSGVAEHYVVIDATVWPPRLRFRYPPEVQALAEEYGESIERAIVRTIDEQELEE